MNHSDEIDESFLGAHVTELWIAPGARLPMKSVESVQIETGHGIAGDRYENARHRHVTVQSEAQLQEAAAEFGSPIPAWGTRRNITVSNGAVPLKPGIKFRIGPVMLEVVRVAAPCTLLDDDLGRGAKKTLHRRAGAVCRVLDGGRIATGSLVTLTP